ncbi:MAG: hypothetical protein S4CHLAM7_09740 [Chlamydiae bacterium]|nr:hypothetical protein [Chlamydiota bacterium]
MDRYFFKRLLWIPVTLFLILIVNFVLINCVQDTLPQWIQAEKNEDYFHFSLGPVSYDQEFRKHYGLDLPILINLWPFKSLKSVQAEIGKNPNLMLKAPFLIESLKTINKNNSEGYELLAHAVLQKVIGTHYFQERQQRAELANDLCELESIIQARSPDLLNWIEMHEEKYVFQYSWKSKILVAFTETRLFYYLKHLVRFEFGTLRSDITQPVERIVLHHFKTSLLLITFPLVAIFIFSQLLGLIMALKFQNISDKILTLLCMFLYALPLYIVIPLLIEKVAIPYGLPLQSEFSIKSLVLPSIALIYGALALYARYNKTLFLYLFNEPYLKVAKAKGLRSSRLIFVHTLRHASMTLVPLFLGAIGPFLGGLVIVENLFEIKGFGYLFYQSMIQKDYHVLLFSILLSSSVSIIGHFLADFFLYKFDPRIKKNDSTSSFLQT